MSNCMGVGIFWIGLNRADLSCWRLTLSRPFFHLHMADNVIAFRCSSVGKRYIPPSIDFTFSFPKLCHVECLLQTEM